jgi:hypothetical protein
MLWGLQTASCQCVITMPAHIAVCVVSAVVGDDMLPHVLLLQAITAVQAALGGQPADSDSAAKPDGTATSAPAPIAGTGPATASIPEEGVGELEAVSLEDRTAQAPRRLVVVLYGNPLSGTSVQAAALCSRYGLPCVSVDSLLQVRP